MDRHASPATPSARAMDKYEQLSVVGEGSYGVVLKCRRRDNGKLVAIKKFLETEDDATVRKMALREIRMLKKLRHDHLVNLIEVFRRKRRFYLVFEYLDHTLLDELEATPGGLGEETSKKRLFQLLRGIEYCHQNSIIHRDVKPENVLVSNLGIVKLCDLGFARTLAAPGEPYTEYVATRWYRAPELLVADHKYGPEVDIWAIGCLFAEMLTGDPLFPGDSDIDQLALIVKTVGKLASRHQQIVSRLSDRPALQASGPRGTLPGTGLGKELLAACLRTEPRARPTANALLRHKYFQQDNFFERFAAELRHILGKEVEIPPATSKTYGPARSTKSQPQWTINIIPDISKTPETNVSDQLIDYNFSLNERNPSEDDAGGNAEKVSPPPRVICPTNPPPSLKPSLPPPSRTGAPKQTAQQKSINKAINETFQNFSVPVNSYPRTHYIKKINNKLVTDEEMMRGRPMLHKTPKKVAASELSLPYVPGASNSPMKKAKKPTYKAYESYDAARPEVVGTKTPTSLPYV